MVGGGFHKWWYPIAAEWFLMENPVNMDDMKICLKYHQLDILA